MRELARCSGSQFDPQIVEALVQILDTDEELRALLPLDIEIAPAAAAVATGRTVSASVPVTQNLTFSAHGIWWISFSASSMSAGPHRMPDPNVRDMLSRDSLSAWTYSGLQ
jgi:hypothetical protein